MFSTPKIPQYTTEVYSVKGARKGMQENIAYSKTSQKYFSVFYDKEQNILYMHKVFIVHIK